jgi:hypothetical protein
MVIIDGFCASACTIVLGTVPHDRICVTPAPGLDFTLHGIAVPTAGK